MGLLEFLICWLVCSLIAMLLTYINDKRESHYVDFGIFLIVAHLIFGLIMALIIVN